LSAKDPDPTVPTISRVEDRERILAEALAHADAQEAQYRVLPAADPVRGRWKIAVASLLLALAAWVALSPPAWVTGPAAPRPTEGDLERGLRAAIYLQVQQVEAYRLREGRVPSHLSELPVHLPGLTLVRSNNRVYQIRGLRPDGVPVVYDSARPSPAFEAAAAGWISAEGQP